MKKNLTELVFILDRSGSMAGLEKDTILVLRSNLSATISLIMMSCTSAFPSGGMSRLRSSTPSWRVMI